MNGWDAFRTGLGRASRYRWILLILFGVNLLNALCLAAIPAWGLASEIGHRPAIQQAADGVDAWLVFETLLSPVIDMEMVREPEPPVQLQMAALLGLLTALALPLIAGLPAAFLNGGVLLAFAETKPFRLRRFLWGCWHWFGAFLLLGAVQGVVSTALFVPTIGTAIGVITTVGGWLAWIIVPLLALLALLWLVLIEYIRIVAVVGQTRNLFRALGGAIRFFFASFRNLLAVIGLYILALALLIVLHALYRWGLMPRLPLDWWPVVLVVQQAFILARLWARMVRMAGGVALYRERAGG